MAFRMDLKVVKVGDIGALPEEQSILLPDTSTSESSEIAFNPFDWRPASQFSVCSGGWNVYRDDNLLGPITEEVELPQKGGAPDHWPLIPQMCRRRSCAASGERTNCVKKAVEHLQLLLDILTDCAKKTEEKVPEESDVSDDRTLSICDFDPKDEERSLVPLTTNLVPSRCVEALKDYKSHSQLRAVVRDVILLLASLQEDCQRTEAKLESEEALYSQLSLKLDELSRQKFIDLKAAVQEGHEFCKRQVYHILKRIRALHLLGVQYRRKIKSKEHLRSQMIKAISLKDEHIPLIQTKMLQEDQQTDKIQNDLIEAEQLLSEALEHQRETKSKYRESMKIAYMTQFELEQELQAFGHEFNLLSAAAEKAERDYHMMTKNIGEARQQTEDNHKEITILKVKLENSKTKTNSVKLQDGNRKNKLMKRWFETKRKRDENERIELQLKSMKDELKFKVLQLAKEMQDLKEEFKTLFQINLTKNDLIENMRERMVTSQKQRTFYEESRKRMNFEVMKLENQVFFALEELRRLHEMNRELSDSAHKEQEKFTQEEKAMLRIINRLQHEIDCENHIYFDVTKKNLELECELKYVQTDAEEEKNEHCSMVNDLMESINKTEDKIARLKCVKEQKDQKLKNLRERKMEIKERFEQVIRNNDDYLVTLTTYPVKSQEKGRELEMKMIEMSYEEERMKDEMEMMAEKRIVLEENLEQLQRTLEELIEEVQELDFKLDIASNHTSSTKDRSEQAYERIRTEREEHRDLIRCRKETLEEILQKKVQSLKENEQLASTYRTARMTLCQRKEEYVLLSEDTMRLKRALNDLKQLMRVQMKIHYNNGKYCEHRGLYHRKQLAYFVNASERSQKTFKQLESEFKAKLRRMAIDLDEIISIHLQKRQDLLPRISHPVH